MPTVYLFKFPEYIPLVKWDDLAPNINWPMIQYDTKIYKGVTNTIDFLVKNNDRRTVKLVDYKLRAQIQQVNTPSNSQGFLPELLLIKDCAIIDDSAGKAKLVLTAEEIQHWNPGYYRYVIELINGAGQNEYLYTDVNKTSFGSFELKEGVISSLAPPQIFESADFTPNPINLYDDIDYLTGYVAGDAQAGRANGTHTFAVYQDKFQGRFWIQGSLSDESPLPTEWFNIPLGATTPYYQFTTENNTDSPALFNFTMNLYWVRFIYQPSIGNKGKFLKVLYKN